MSNEAQQVAVPLTLPLIFPSDEVVENSQLPDNFEVLIENGYMTKEEAVSFLQWNLIISQVASSVPEFLNMFRAVKEEKEKSESRIVKPGAGIITPDQNIKF